MLWSKETFRDSRAGRPMIPAEFRRLLSAVAKPGAASIGRNSGQPAVTPSSKNEPTVTAFE